MMRRHLGRLVVLLLVLTAVFFWGVGVGFYHWPPFSMLSAVQRLLTCDRDPTRPTELRETQGSVYTVSTYRYSYYALLPTGGLDLREGMPYRLEGRFESMSTIDPNKTALIVMDPWVDAPSEHLSRYYGEVVESRIIPLVERALARGHPIIVLTNDPDFVRYNSDIHPDLKELANAGGITVMYHQDLDGEKFTELLRSEGIDTLIYTGFASNMCVIGRLTGMIPMLHQGFRMFFVPEASAAVELPDTWENRYIHEAMTLVIAQWIASILEYDEYMNVLAPQ